MDGHLHTDPVEIFMTAVGVMIVFQTARWFGAKLASNPSTAKVGAALGGAFTFG